MRSRLLAVVLLTFVPALTSCLPENFGSFFFRFTEPSDYELILDGEFDFALHAPSPSVTTGLKVWIGDQALEGGDLTHVGDVVTGSVSGLTPGYYTMLAKIRIVGPFFDIPFWAWRVVVVPGAASFQARGSVGQVHVTHAKPGIGLKLLDATQEVVGEGVADEWGSLIFREVDPGAGYRVLADASATGISDPVDVLSFAGSTPDQSFYDNQVLEPGYGYLTTRDGTKLSVFVALPGPPEDGPYPMLVNYSGYTPSQPNGAIQFGGIDLSSLCGSFPILCDAPNAPEALLAGVLGFGTVGVNMRGTGCSGGAYDFFEPLQLLDGYDIIEVVAAQEWTHKVGMVGISFPGISQLFVASTKPPNLAAITPLAVISGSDTTLAPGGIVNNGFAVEWANQVLNRADPYGQGWEQGRVDDGDTICEENQLLHAQKVDIIEKAFTNPFYVPEVYDPLNPRTFVDEIEVPVFTAGAWQDEQTGGHFPDLWNRFTGSPLVRYTGYNGAHADGFVPAVLAEWKNFLDFYVTEELRPIPPLLRNLAPLLFQEVFGAIVAIPEERFAGVYGTFEDAKAAYEAEPPIRILMESGGSPDAEPGAPVPGFELFFDSWPPPATDPLRLYLHADGSLREFEPSESASSSGFLHDDAKGQETYIVNGSFEKALPNIVWNPWEPSRQVVFVSEPFDDDVVMLGHASADLWIQSLADDADIEVMLSEVRPDGKETYVSSGWLRASRRALSPESSPLKPVQTHVEADAAPLETGVWTLVRVEIYPFAHAFREGSQLRLEVATPGSNKGRWKFDVLQLGEGVYHAVSHSRARASSVLLPVIPGAAVPTELPACPSLRSQPCRDYVPHVNVLLE